MNIAQTKIELAQHILETNDEELIRKIKDLMDNDQDEWWNNLPESVRESISESMNQIENKQTSTNAAAFSRFKKWVKK
jgi:phage-related protein